MSKIIPFAIGATANAFGVEGTYPSDVVGTLALSRPEAFTVTPMVVDVEIEGELTRGMTVFDERWACQETSNVDLITDLDVTVARQYLLDLLGGK